MFENLSKNDNFNLILPHIKLRDYILFYNLVNPRTNMFSDCYTIMPNVNGTITLSFDGIGFSAEVWGASTHSFIIGSQPNGLQHLLLIEFKPGGLYHLTGSTQEEFTNRRIELESVSPSLYQCLCNIFETVNTVSELADLLDEVFLSFLFKHELHSELIFATKKIINSGGRTSVHELVDIVNYSERHLNRIFYMQTGMNVKTFSRLIRFNSVLQELHTTPYSIAQLSIQNGYYDQSHLIQDFKTFCGVTPEAYIKNMSDFSYIKIEA